MKSWIVALYFLLGFSAQETTKTLIAPIYSNTLNYSTGLIVTEAEGRFSPFSAHGFTAEGRPVLGDRETYSLRQNSYEWVLFEPDFGGNFIGNGWARLTYPANRSLRALSHIAVYRDGKPAFETFSGAVAPGTDFRFYGSKVKGEETAVSIVNPTGSKQAVTVRFHPKRKPTETQERSWEIAPMSRLSRFLSELVRVDGYDPPSTGIHGLVHVQGETRIAVGALNFSRKTGFFSGIPVSSP